MRPRFEARRGRTLVRVAENPVLLAAFDAQPDLPALRRKPIQSADFRLAAQLLLVVTVLAEGAITFELRLQLARDELGHQRVVEEADSRDLVRDHVLRHGEVT